MKKIFTLITIAIMAIYAQAEVFNLEVSIMEVSPEGTNILLTGNSSKGPVSILLYNGVEIGYGEYGWEDGLGNVYGQIGKVDVEGTGTWSEEGLVASLTKCSDNNTYNLTMKAFTSMELSFSNMSIEAGEEDATYTYLFMAMGETPVAGVQFALASATDYIGTFSITDLDKDNSAIIYSNGTCVFPSEGTIVISNENNVVVLSANITGSDGKSYTIRMTTPEELELIGTNLKKDEDEGTLFFIASADDWSWMLDLSIADYTGYGKYTNVAGVYVDENGDEWAVTGTGTYSFDENKQSDVFEGKLVTEDRSLVLSVKLSYEEKEVVATPMVINNAVLTVTKSEILYIEGDWNDGTADHTVKFECMEGLMYDKTFIEVSLLIDGGPMQGGSFAVSTNAILTKEGNIATLTGTFKSNYDESLAYAVTISGALPCTGTESAVENIFEHTAQVKTIEKGQLIILRDGVKYNATGAAIQ